VGGRELACTELTVPAQAGAEPATFWMLECPALPWRVVELQLIRNVDGAELWRVKRSEQE